MTLDDLRCAGLPTVLPTSRLRQRLSPLRLLSVPSLDARQRLNAYWATTIERLRRRQIWRVNPLALAWHAIQDIKNTLLWRYLPARRAVGLRPLPR